MEATQGAPPPPPALPSRLRADTQEPIAGWGGNANSLITGVASVSITSLSPPLSNPSAPSHGGRAPFLLSDQKAIQSPSPRKGMGPPCVKRGPSDHLSCACLKGKNRSGKDHGLDAGGDFLSPPRGPPSLDSTGKGRKAASLLRGRHFGEAVMRHRLGHLLIWSPSPSDRLLCLVLHVPAERRFGPKLGHNSAPLPCKVWGHSVPH